MLGTIALGLAFLAATTGGAPVTPDTAAELELSQAVLVTPEDLSGPERKAVDMLLDEVEKRSRIRWAEAHAMPAENIPVVAVGPAQQLKALAANYADAINPTQAAEAYQIRVMDNRVVLVAGTDARGVLFGVGRLLRELRMEKNVVRIPAALDIATAPKYPLRGHQLGYRPKVNSYDGWTVPMWEQYFRDLAVFGTNTVELLPPRTDDDADSPHFVMPQIDMMAHMSRLANEYGLDVWIWYPAIGVNYEKPATIETALTEWESVLSKLPRVDAIMVPSGDPGHLVPKDLVDFLEKATVTLHKAHPKAQMWVSMQGFNLDGINELLGLLQKQQPTWLTGIVFGPQNRLTLPELRQAVPPQYPIRHYPDITHSVQCQFPVPDWDTVYAITEQREVINPRPTNFADIIRAYDDYTCGFITYSEGCNDDVNKIIWSSLGWDPDVSVMEVLRQYARYFIGLSYEDTFAQGILGLEQNWRGPILTNKGIFSTLEQFQTMECSASPQVLLNWRFQQALYRAYYDAYNARRYAYETELEQRAMDVLRQAPMLGANRAMNEAEKILNRAMLEPVAQDLRARVFELAEALYQSIRMQLSVPRYKAIHVDRGANLDLIDTPLNDRPWLEKRFAELRQAGDSEKMSGISAIVNWINPGPGGFYDNLGFVTQQPHLVREPDRTSDPEFRETPLMGREYEPGRKLAWTGYAETRYDSPLRLQYEGLDPRGEYKVRVAYSGDNFEIKMRLMANGQYEIHPYQDKPYPIRPLEFDIPKEATSGGKLTLSWTQAPGRRGNGRGCQVGEVWLIKKTP
ncbi:MAG TPA: hypothetical protein PLI09_19065 [Candidatus Hydrogenedentes bacterium]|nr:hypothetical protein [Candidatus Hydrogenedentota bacterium]